MQTIILSIIILALSLPTALLLHRYTSDEKKLYKKYFRPLFWILAILSLIFFTLNITIALTFLFMCLTILIWNKL